MIIFIKYIPKASMQISFFLFFFLVIFLHSQEQNMDNLDPGNIKNLLIMTKKLPVEAQYPVEEHFKKHIAEFHEGMHFSAALLDTNSKVLNSLIALLPNIQYIIVIEIDYAIMDNAPTPEIFVFKLKNNNEIFIIDDVKKWNAFIETAGIKITQKNIWNYTKAIFPLLFSDSRRHSNDQICEDKKPTIEKKGDIFIISYTIEAIHDMPQVNRTEKTKYDSSLKIHESGKIIIK